MRYVELPSNIINVPVLNNCKLGISPAEDMDQADQKRCQAETQPSDWKAPDQAEKLPSGTEPQCRAQGVSVSSDMHNRDQPDQEIGQAEHQYSSSKTCKDRLCHTTTWPVVRYVELPSILNDVPILTECKLGLNQGEDRGQADQRRGRAEPQHSAREAPDQAEKLPNQT